MSLRSYFHILATAGRSPNWVTMDRDSWSMVLGSVTPFATLRQQALAMGVRARFRLNSASVLYTQWAEDPTTQGLIAAVRTSPGAVLHPVESYLERGVERLNLDGGVSVYEDGSVLLGAWDEESASFKEKDCVVFPSGAVLIFLASGKSLDYSASEALLDGEPVPMTWRN